MRAFLVAALTLAMIGIASGQVWIMSPSGGGRASGSGVSLTAGAILLVNGTNFVLQTDGTSKICTAVGGC